MKVVQHYAPLENRDRALLLFITQRQWLPFCFMGPIFESRGLVGPLFHNFRSITEIGMEPVNCHSDTWLLMLDAQCEWYH